MQGDPISLMLFVIVMEYHSKCEKLNIVDIRFIDDLLLFIRGDVISVQVVMDRFHAFSKAISLHVNPTKCKLYCGGMDSSTMNQIAGFTGFRFKELPFRYLGILLNNKKLSVI